MGCGSSNTKVHLQKDKTTLDNILSRKSVRYMDDSLLKYHEKGDRKDLILNEKKLKNLFKICDYNEAVDLKDLFFLDSSFYSFFEKIGNNKKMHTLSLRNIEFEGNFKQVFEKCDNLLKLA
jgi:hypothetical protein